MPADPPPFVPLNPWGRAMPKVKRRPTHNLYQVFAETEAGEHIAISPKMGGEDGFNAAGQICAGANDAIIRRIRPEWLNAYVKKFELVPH